MGGRHEPRFRRYPVQLAASPVAADELKEMGCGRSLEKAGFTPDMVHRIQTVLDMSIPQFKAATR
jgi:hypothetical protein